MSLTGFIAEFRSYYSRNSTTNELGDSLIGAAAKQAVRKISKHKPRANQRKNLDIIVESTSVELPADFMSATVGELYRLKTGSTLDNQQWLSKWLSIFGLLRFEFSCEGSQFRDDGRVLWNRRGSSFGFAETESLELFQTDAGLYALWLDTDSASARTVKNFQYNALHLLNDDSPTAKDTISADLRDVLLDETMKIALMTQARRFRREGKNAEAEGFEEQAALYGNEIKTIASLGDAA